ncbi:MAG: hypothetical protein K1X53_05005 [Candidatus Sumerlaeaceae bacterium]|nr:hypothetical protein [Candidatus Sumerlaeaceae bacterium]
MKRLLTVLCLICAQVAFAGQPVRFNYQAKLTDSSGIPLTGAHTIYASIYVGGTAGAANSGTQVFGESSPISISNGVVNYTVGTGTIDTFGAGALSQTMLAGNAEHFLQIAIDSAGNVTLPRTRLESVPYAVLALTAETATTATYATNSSSQFPKWGVTGQGLVWNPLSHSLESPSRTLGEVSLVDLATVNASAKGYAGGFTDGKYGYFVPNNNGAPHGLMARVDLANFATSGVTLVNVSAGDSALKGFVGGFSDGRYGYLVPNNNGAYSGKIARIDLNNFSTTGVTSLDLTQVDSECKGYVGGFGEGQYGYFVPNYNGSIHVGKIARVDLNNFTTGGVTILDATSVDVGLTGFAGGFCDGKYGYFVPSRQSGASNPVVRVSLSNFSTTGITTLDVAQPSGGLAWIGGFTDGYFGYLVPNGFNGGGGVMVRFDLSNFATPGVQFFNLATLSPTLTGFWGGFSDGKYGYLVPNYNGGNLSGNLARIDFENFNLASVKTLDMALTDSGLKNFLGGFTDGHYGYFVPSNNGSSGKIARVRLDGSKTNSSSP